MCGIIAMTSREDISQEVVHRLEMLEYRGYDSYGIASLVDAKLCVQKDAGSIGDAVRSGRLKSLPSTTLAVGHTRWATHGRASQVNAHPHLSSDGSIAVAHNGVIANGDELRRGLERSGVTFISETDSEVAAHLVAYHVRNGSSVLDAVFRTVCEITGDYALAIISIDEPGTIYGAKNKSPLVVGRNGTRAVLASDYIALSGMSVAEARFLEDGDIVKARTNSIEIFSARGGTSLTRTSRHSVALGEDQRIISKGGFPHFMIKEIHETPLAATEALKVSVADLVGVVSHNAARPITLFGAGSGLYLAQIGQYLLNRLAHVAAAALPSDEAIEIANLMPGDSVIAISQSGETFDTLEMCRFALDKGAVLTSISNGPHSTQERLAARCIQQNCGPEISVLSTKSIVSQATILARIALELGNSNGSLSSAQYAGYRTSLARLPHTLYSFITDATEVLWGVAREYHSIGHWFFTGRGILYPVAMESALKFKEASYRHAEGISTGSFKHGPISLIDPQFCTVALIPHPAARADLHSAVMINISEIAARGGRVIGMGAAETARCDRVNFAHYVELPYHGDDVADPIIQLVAGQLLAYSFALNLGREIDRPRHLAKSVTVR